MVPGFAIVLLVLGLVWRSYQDQNDPLKSFCRRFGHATALIDQRLFIDGGLINRNPIAQNPLNYTNPNLLYHDLRVNNQGMPQLYANLSKNLTVPAVSGGFLWEDNVNKVFYQFGGEYEHTPQPLGSVLLFDALLNQWNQTGVQNEDHRVAWGAGVSVSNRAEGYYLGGWMSNQTTPGWAGIPVATSNLIRYDMISNTLSNNTGPDSTGRAEGVMVYIPASEDGLLIYFGGILDPYHNGKWYNQTAIGNVPQARRRFCAGATWADDYSSYNIYLYGGLGIAPNDTAFDDVYILSLPSFTWIKWWPNDDSDSGHPHHSLTCNVINKSQMLIIGGTFPADPEYCDQRLQYGTHNLNLGANGPSNAKWDLFYPNITKYQVPQEIIAEVGGGPSGGATVVKPQNNWDHRDLPIYFSEVPKLISRTPTRLIPTVTGLTRSSPGLTGRRRASIIGGSIAGFLLLISILLVVLCLLHQKKSRRRSNTPMKSAELPTAMVHEVPPTTIHEVPTPPAYPGNSYHEVESVSPPSGAEPLSPRWPEHYAELQSDPLPQPKPEDIPEEAEGITHHQNVPSIHECQIAPVTSLRGSTEREEAKSVATTPVRFYQQPWKAKKGEETSVKVVEDMGR